MTPPDMPRFANVRDGGNLPEDLAAWFVFGRLALILLVLGCLLIAAPKIAASVLHYTALYAG